MKSLQNHSLYDVAFVGAGPASLAAVSALASAGPRRILILDAGGNLASRGCPGLIASDCTSCSGDGCRVIEGLGGAGAGFGNKLCLLPASSGCLNLVHGSLQGQVSDIVSTLIGRPIDSAISNDRQHSVTGDIELKHYTADVLFRKQYRSLIARLVAAASRVADIKPNTRVVGVERTDGGLFQLKVEDGGRFFTKNLVFGSGRSSALSLPELITPLGVKFEELLPDIGFRLELETGLLGRAFWYQTDPKLKITHENGVVSRTFCACKDGHIVPVKFGDSFFADGAFLNAPTGKTNIALMVRSDRSIDRSALDRWCHDVNSAAPGGLHLRSVRATPTTGIDAIRSAIADAIPYWPTAAHQEAMSELLDAVISTGAMAIGNWSDIQGQTEIGVFAPAIDNYWCKPELGLGFTTSVPGLSVIGDAAGYSRGVVQAIYSGVGWAAHNWAFQKMPLVLPIDGTRPSECQPGAILS